MYNFVKTFVKTQNLSVFPQPSKFDVSLPVPLRRCSVQQSFIWPKISVRYMALSNRITNGLLSAHDRSLDPRFLRLRFLFYWLELHFTFRFRHILLFQSYWNFQEIPSSWFPVKSRSSRKVYHMLVQYVFYFVSILILITYVFYTVQ